MRIGILLRELDVSGGTQRHALCLARALRRMGEDVSVSEVPDLLAQFQQYGDLSARQTHEAGRRCRLSGVLHRPPFAFFRTYVPKLGSPRFMVPTSPRSGIAP